MIQDITKKDKKELTFKDKVVINIYDIVSVLAVSLVTIMLFFTFMFRIVGVQGTSMLPTLEHNDWLLVSAFDPEPKYGQVVIVTQPNWFDEPIVKRIIATENQVVDIDFSTGDVFVDGELLNEPYINNLTLNSDSVKFPVTVPENHVFVMGDNRQGSTDSRSDKIGFVQEEYILGVVKYKFCQLITDSYGNVTGIDFYPLSEWKVE